MVLSRHSHQFWQMGRALQGSQSMETVSMSRKHNTYFHVYILASASDPHMVKVGKANNLKRPAYFRKAGYAGVTDWQQVVTIAADSNEAAFAIESMLKAKLYNQGFLRPKKMWDDLKVTGRRVGATECFNCHFDHAIDVGIEMAEIYEKFVA